jgi:putative membrane protein
VTQNVPPSAGGAEQASPAEAGAGAGGRTDALGRRLFPDGAEPDARFTLANERTFLARIRTSLALIAGGIGVEMFRIDDLTATAQKLLACLLLVAGCLLAIGAGWRWWRVETAMRHHRPLPVTPLLPIAGVAVALGAIVVTVLVVLR